MPERSDRHGWIDLLVPDGPFLSAAALDVQTVGENWPTRLSADQRSLLTAPSASEAEEDEGWDDSSWDGRRARVTELLTELLGYREGKTLVVTPGVAAHHHIYRARVSADFAIHAPDDPDDVRMVVMCGPDAIDDPTRLDPARTHTHDGWVSTPVQRAALLARQADADLALVTNGREHLLVNVVTGTTGSAMWTVNGLEDRHARDAFVALLHKQRVLHRTVPLSKLIELSQDRQHELTDTLGKQVRRAAEALVNAISRANRTSRGRLLEALTGQQVYAATTRVLMRTVFLLVAEERGLLPVAENQLFADQYAMSTLLDKLEEDAYRNRSAMERRSGAWQRMMALSRAVHAGIEHDDVRLPAYGGNLFDPDEHPFLEARITAADGKGFEQLVVGVVDDFTVLTVLRHLQIADGQRISFRSLDVEQIGHVYEALLDHAAVIVPEDQVAVLGLIGKAGDEPEVSLVELEGWTAKSDKELGEQLVDLGVAAEARGVYQAIDDGLAPDSEVAQTLNVAVANDPALRERVERYAPLLRTDARGIALVFRPGDVYVTETSSKRDSGTAYTPRSLAEEIAQHTLDPLIYDPGPQNEPDESKWKLKTPDDILDLKICDPAVGSAAILVAAVRHLAEALLQARVERGALSPEALASGAADVESVDARVQARRAIVSRCIYGVDRDPMAVEMAKLSLWLITMAKDAPFSFLDHAIRHGDSLLGIVDLDQLRKLHLEPSEVSGSGRGLSLMIGSEGWWETIDNRIDELSHLRAKLRALPDDLPESVQEKARLHKRATTIAHDLAVVADAVTASYLKHAGSSAADRDAAQGALQQLVADLDRNKSQLQGASQRRLEDGNPNHSVPRRPMHWPIAFPEVFVEGDGFDALVGNPPWVGTKRLASTVGSDVRNYCVRHIAGGSGQVDLCTYFVRRGATLASVMGFLLSRKVTEGDDPALGFGALVADGWSVHFASSVQPWPTKTVHMPFVRAGARRGPSASTLFDGVRSTAPISGRLTRTRLIDGPTIPLRANKSIRAGKGLNLNDGGGLLVAASDARRMLANCPHLEPWLGPWITSAIVGQTPCEAKDYAIDLTGLSETDARQVAPELLELAERTKDHRSGLPPSKQRVKDKWWLPEAQARALRDWLTGIPSDETHVPVMAQTCKGAIPTMAPVTSKFSQDVFVFAEPDCWWWFGILASYPHQLWLLQFGSRTAGGTPRYGGKTVLETFPFDAFRSIPLQDDAKALWESLQSLMADRGFGVSGAVEEVAAGTSAAVDDCRAAWASINDRLMRAPGFASYLQIEEFGHGPFASSAGPRFWPSVSHEEVLDALLRVAYSLAAKERGVSVDTVMKQVGHG